MYHSDIVCERLALSMRSLARSGYSITMVRWCRNENTAPVSADEWKTVDIRIPSFYGKLSNIFAVLRVYRKMASIYKRQKSEALFCNSLIFLPLAVLLGRLYKKRTIYDSMEFYTIDYARHFGPLSPIFIKALEFMENTLVRGAHGVLAVDSKDQCLIKRLRRHQANAEMVPNLPEAVSASQAVSPGRPAGLQAGSGDPVFVYAGDFNLKKGAHVCLEAVEILAMAGYGLRLLIIGSRECYVDEAKLIARQRGIEHLVRFLPYLQYRDMMTSLRDCAAGLCVFQQSKRNSNDGTFNSRKIFTYMEAGIPMVISHFFGARPLVEALGCAISVDETDAGSIARAMSYIISCPEQAREMGRRGRKAFEERFNWQEGSEPALFKVIKNALS